MFCTRCSRSRAIGLMQYYSSLRNQKHSFQLIYRTGEINFIYGDASVFLVCMLFKLQFWYQTPALNIFLKYYQWIYSYWLAHWGTIDSLQMVSNTTAACIPQLNCLWQASMVYSQLNNIYKDILPPGHTIQTQMVLMVWDRKAQKTWQTVLSASFFFVCLLA